MSVELEYKSYWSVKTLNMDYRVVGGKIIVDIHELEELRLYAYEVPRYIKRELRDGTISTSLEDTFLKEN